MHVQCIQLTVDQNWSQTIVEVKGDNYRFPQSYKLHSFR